MSSPTMDEKLVTVNVTVDCSALPINPKNVLRKLDLHLLPAVGVLYFLCSLDRTNIGNAKISGLVVDLHLTGIQFNLCVAILLPPGCAFWWIRNTALKKFGPPRWLPSTMFLWGCIMVSMAFVRSFGGLMAARVFLGAAEGEKAGFLPGVTYYLSTWCPGMALARRIGIVYSTSSLANAFRELLAFVIEKMNGMGRLAGWSWIFLLEGLLTVCVATILYFCMYDTPESAPFLADAERDWLLETIENDNHRLSKHFKREYVLQALQDPQAYIFAAIFLLISFPALSFPIFLPTPASASRECSLSAHSPRPGLRSYWLLSSMNGGRMVAASESIRGNAPMPNLGTLMMHPGRVSPMPPMGVKTRPAPVYAAARGVGYTPWINLAYTATAPPIHYRSCTMHGSVES